MPSMSIHHSPPLLCAGMATCMSALNMVVRTRSSSWAWCQQFQAQFAFGWSLWGFIAVSAVSVFAWAVASISFCHGSKKEDELRVRQNVSA